MQAVVPCVRFGKELGRRLTQRRVHIATPASDTMMHPTTVSFECVFLAVALLSNLLGEDSDLADPLQLQQTIALQA